MSAPTAAVSVDGVTKKFGDFIAVNNLSLTIEPGEVVAVLGPNGAGKTTAVDMLLGPSPPPSGSVKVLGRSPRVYES